MSRPALWRPTAANGADPAGDGVVPQPPQVSPEGAHTAPGAALPAGSAELPRFDHQVQRFERIAALHAELAEAYRGLAQDRQDQLAVTQERGLMSDVKTARLFSVRDVAELLVVSDRTVRRLRRRGVLPAGIEIAGVIRWTAESIQRWIDERGRA